MNKYQKRRYDAIIRAQDFHTKFAILLATLVEWPALLVMFKDILKKIQKAIQQQAVDISVATPDKASQKVTMGKMVSMFAKRASVEAHLLGKTQLELGLKKPKSYILSANDDDAGTRAWELKELMKNNLADLVNLTAADITAMEAALTAYTAIVPVPNEMKKDKKDYGTDPLPGLFDDMDVVKELMTRVIHSYLPDQAANWDSYIKVGLPEGRRRTSLAVRYTELSSGVVLKNVTATATNGKISEVKKSSAKGWVRFYSMTSDLWTVTSVLDTYVTDVKQGIGLDDKHRVKLEIKLVKSSEPVTPTPAPDPEVTTGILSTFVFIKSTGEAQPGVQISIPGLDYVSTTDEDGEDYCDEIEPGTYQGTIYMEGYNTISFNATIKAGETTLQKFYLEVADVAPSGTPGS